MKRIYTKKVRKNGNSVMVSGGLGRHGPYAYGGVKTKGGLSAGASIGTQGRQLYGSVNKRRGQVRVKYNLETKRATPRARYYRKSFLKSILDIFNDLMSRRD